MGKKARVGAKLLVLGVAVTAAVFGYRWFENRRDALPALTIPDISSNDRQAGHAERSQGEVLFRGAVPADSQGPSSTAKAATGLAPLKEGAAFFLGTFFQLGPKSNIQMVTTGNWIVGLDGDGEFVFEDARTNSTGSIHTGVWFVRRGTFRAKPHDYDPSDHELEIRTPIARVLLKKAEIGMRVSEGGGGQIWLVNGKATVVWNDGRRKELHQRGMDYL